MQTARRILRLPPLVCLACYLDCAPEALPVPEDIADALLPELEHLIAHARRQTPHERTRALAQSLLAEPDCPVNQRLLGALARHEARYPEA